MSIRIYLGRSIVATYLGRSIVATAFILASAMHVGAEPRGMGQPPIVVAQNAPAFAHNASIPDAPIIQRGDAVVTGFSGVTALKPKPNAKLEDYLIIDTQGAALQFFDLSQMFGPNDARLVDAPRLHTVPAGQIGQVFGVTLDDGQPATGPAIDKDPVPNIYATATSAYGLQIVETRQVGNEKVRERAKRGSAQASWMDGQFGVGLGGGPGSIWKIDGRTGESSLFANVTLDGIANGGPALGAIAFDPTSRRLFVSDLQTGMIHAFDLTGREVGRFDHGTQGRPRKGLAAVAFDPKSRVEITSPAFNVEDPSSWGYAVRERKVWGLAVHDGRLFYASVDGPNIWSVGLTPNGDFTNDARVEIEVQSQSGDAVSAITFGRDGTIYLSQRGQQVPSYDYRVMATPNTAETLRYKRKTLPNGNVVWENAPEEYAIGHAPGHRSSDGGVALGYGYDKNGFMRHDVCEGTVWTTGDVLRQSVPPDPRLTAGGEVIVHGLQGNPIGAVKPNNNPPMDAYFLDYDSQFEDPSYRGHMGQVAIWSCGSGPAVTASRPPHITIGIPGDPVIHVTKKCSSAGLGDRMHCRVTLFNAGGSAPKGRVGFTDAAEILHGPPGAANIQIVSATPDDQAWNCSRVPSSNLACEIDGRVLQPGHRHSVDVVMDVSGIARTPDFRLRNCATLSDRSETACASGGGDLIVNKSGDRVCEAGGLCTFNISVANHGRRTFDGRMLLADSIAIPGVAALDIAFISPQIRGCNPASLPFLCNVPMTIGPGARRSFEVTVLIPANAVPPGGTVQARQCFFASDPNLIPDQGRRPVTFWRTTVQTLSPTSPLGGPGFRCWNFQVKAPGVTAGPPVVTGTAELSLAATPSPATFTAAGQKITYTYTLRNTGSVPLPFVSLIDNKATDLKCPGAAVNVQSCKLSGRACGSLGAGASLTCTGGYTTRAGDVGFDITATAVAGGAITGPDPSNPGFSPRIDVRSKLADTVVKFAGQPALSLAATPSPTTFSTANQKITYSFTVKNTGNTPVSGFVLNDSKATGVKCPPANTGPIGGPLAAGASVTCTGSYTTTAGDVGKDIANTANLAGTSATGNVPSPTSANALVKFVGTAALSLAVTPAPATFSAANQSIIYAYTVKNTGSLPVTIFALTDSNNVTHIKCPPTNVGQNGGPLAAGAAVTCTGTYTTTAADLGKDLASTTTIVGASTTGMIPPPPPANATVKFVGKPGFSVSHSCSPQVYSAAGQSIVCDFTVKNTGTIPIKSCQITGSKINVSCPQGPIPVGGSVKVKGVYTSTAADVGKNIVIDFTIDGLTL